MATMNDQAKYLQRARTGPRRAVVGRIYVAEYSVPPSHTELNIIADDIEALRDRIGGPVHYLGIVKASAEVPTAPQREALSSFGKRVNAICETAHLVLEGDGFRNAIQRSVITAIHVLKQQSVTCYRTTAEAAARLGPLVGQSEPSTLIESIRRALAT
jgi:hypothetical protein